MIQQEQTKPAEKAYYRWEPPRNYSRDPNARLYECNLCWDSGWRLVWHSKSEWFARQPKYDEAGERIPHGEFVWSLHAATAASRCTCRHGQKISKRIPTYNVLTRADYDPLATNEQNLASLLELVNATPVAESFDPDAWDNR